MTQTIEAFVSTLQAEGVEAGQRAAEKIRAEAEQRAHELIDQAKQRAKQIVDEARVEADRIRARIETELRLAARDTLARLQEALSSALRAVLFPAVRETLADSEFLAGLVRDVVLRYAEGDAAGQGPITVHLSEQVPEEHRRRLTAWILEAFSQRGRTTTAVDLRATLADAGFEYTIRDGTVEVTADSLVDALAEIVAPDVRKLVAEAAAS
jgi:vacuolar-type H+-ATPase subunit H